jgi:hypothetical protein
MARTKLDRKNTNLGALIYHLRQVIDIYRIIGLNVKALKKGGIGLPFFGMVQKLAYESIALSICKIFDPEKDYELYSISGVLGRIKKVRFTDPQKRAIATFASKFGNSSPDPNPHVSLSRTVAIFATHHAVILKSLRTYRNKVIAHPELLYRLRLRETTHNNFEALFEFANEFYRLVHDDVIGVGPALMTMTAGPSLARLLTEIDIAKPKQYFTK